MFLIIAIAMIVMEMIYFSTVSAKVDSVTKWANYYDCVDSYM